jgi:hypothetical protein
MEPVLPAAPSANRKALTRRNLLIAFFLFLATVQIVRVDFFINHQYIDPVLYAHGREAMPFQGRVAMMPVLLWSEHSHAMQAGAVRYTAMLTAGSPLIESYGPDKFISLLVGILSLIVTVVAVAWYGARRLGSQWWLPPALALVIVNVTLDLRVEHNLWYPYDLPHLALFTLAVVSALQRRWYFMLFFYALDLPMRETSLFLLPIVLPLFWLNDDRHRSDLLYLRDWSSLLRAARTRVTALLGLGMFLAWAACHVAIQRHFAANRSETGWRLAINLHDLMLPHHWSQLFSAGGYIAVFVWLSRRRLPWPERLMLYGSIVCLPAVLYFSIWNETRVWLEWTVPLAIAASLQLTGRVLPIPGSPAQQERNANQSERTAVSQFG